jgi:hypothetical protein
MSFPAQTTSKTTDLKDQLAQIGLLALSECIEDFLARAAKGRLSPRQILEEIVRLEMTEGARRSLERRLVRSRIGRFKPITDFDWSWPKKIERDVVELAYQAAVAGYSVLFVTAAELLDDLRTEVAQSTFRRKLTKYASPRLLVIDEVGYLSYDHHAADLLYKVIDRRYERNPVVLTTNLAFRDWNTVFPNATSIATLLDKLTHHADVILIEGHSYRVHESQKEAAARRKKR